jgi:hypothetical protein
MRSNANRWLATLLFGAAITACGGAGDAETAMADSTAARDLTRAGVDSGVVPELKDVPPATAETPPARTPTPRPTPPPVQKTPPPAVVENPPAAAPAPTYGMIAAGTNLVMASAKKVCTNTNKVGDTFTATLTTPVTGTNGAELPVASVATIELTQLTRADNKDAQIIMGFRVVSVAVGEQRYTPDAEVVSAQIDRVPAQDRGDAATKVVGGAAAGAIVGQILGRDRKGTLIGAAVGAAAGAAAAAASDDWDGCIDVGAPMTVKLNAPLRVNLAAN